jgi:hypothetical protein
MILAGNKQQQKGKHKKKRRGKKQKMHRKGKQNIEKQTTEKKHRPSELTGSSHLQDSIQSHL